MRAAFWAGVFALVAFSANAQARGPDPEEVAWFYNRPGATLAEVDADTQACAVLLSDMRGGPRGGAYGLVGHAIATAMIEASTDTVVDDCMIARGYRRFDIAGEAMRSFAERLQAMSEAQRAALVGDEAPPEGVLARRRSNEVWIQRPGEAVAELRDFTPRIMGAIPEGVNNWGRERGTIEVGPNEAVVIASLRSTTGDLAVSTFVRIDPETGDFAPTVLGRRPLLTWIALRTRSREPEPPRAFVVPAGTYAMVNLDMLQLCLGTIGFTIEPGTVVNVGVISVDEEPTASIDPLAPQPMRRVRIDVAERASQAPAFVLPPELSTRESEAAFFNGVPYPCTRGVRAAGLAMPGAPYRGGPGPAAAND